VLGVRLLGPVEVESDGTRLTLSRTLERALLARLALEPGTAISSARLIDDLWGDHVPRDAVASLQGLVYRLRRTLGDEGTRIVRVGSGYALDREGIRVDATDFAQLVGRARADGVAPGEAVELLRLALGLWRGAPLAGLEQLPFAAAQATRLEAARLGSLGDRVQADLDAGRHGEVVAELESLVAEHPFEERFWAQLMLARYRAGSQADALRCYTRLRDFLREELGIEPGPAVADLEQAILRQDPDLAWSGATGATATAPAGAPAAAAAPDPGGERSDLGWVDGAGAPAFVGRRAELEVARAARRRALAGERTLLLVTGEPGIGKTRFTAEMASEFDAGGDLVLRGRWDEDPLCPYQALREALGRYAQHAPPAVVEADAGGLVPVLGRIVPELLETGSAPLASADGGHEGEDDRYRVFDAVSRWLCAVAARRPLVLVLDDMHWADRPSLLLLEYLLRTTSAAPVLLVATYRHTEANATGWLAESLAGIRRTARVERITLSGLSAAETRQLVEASFGRALSGDEIAGAANLQRHTGGNPFFLQEVVRDFDEAGRGLEAWSATDGDDLLIPDGLRDVVRWRLRQLSPACMGVLGAASALGEEFDPAVAGEAVGCEDTALLAVVDEATAAGVVNDSAVQRGGLRFAHAVVRQALYDDLGLHRRAHLHRSLGTTLRARYGDEAEDHAAELARHFYLGAGDGAVDDALHYLGLAAEEALRRVAYEAAAESAGKALEIVTAYRPHDDVTRCRLLLDIGRAIVKAGHTCEADDRFLDAFEVAAGCGRPELLAEAALGYGGVLPAGSEPNPTARSLLEFALSALAPEDGRARALVMGRIAQWGHFETPGPERRALADAAVAMARRLGDPATLAAVLGYRYWALDGPDDPAGQLEVAAEIRRLGEETGDLEVVLHGLKCELHASLEFGDFDRCAAVAGELGELASRCKQPEYLRLRCMWEALVAGVEGRYDDAEAAAAEAATILEHAGHPQQHALYVGLSLPWRWLQGRMEELRPLLELGKTGRSSPGETALTAWVASEIGETARARALLDSLTPAEVAATEHNFHWWFLVVGLVQTSLNLADREWAAALYDMAAPYATHNCRGGQATFLGAASLHLGELALLLGRHDEATAHLEAALARHCAMGARPFVALTERLLATALRSRRVPPDATRADTLDDVAASRAASLGIVLRPPALLGS